jgi:hypothetical protein
VCPGCGGHKRWGQAHHQGEHRWILACACEG